MPEAVPGPAPAPRRVARAIRRLRRLRRRRRRPAIALALLTAAPLAAERPPVTAYGPGDGLAHENVRSLAIDDHGLLWLGTAVGLSRFDGATFRNYGPDEGLPAGFVHALLPAPGGLWLGTATGLYRFETTGRSARRTQVPRFSALRLGEAEEEILTLSVRRAGGAWVGTGSGLWAVEPGRPARLVVGWTGAAGGSDVHAVVESDDGRLWAGGDGGLFVGRSGARSWRPVPLGGVGRVLALAAGGDVLWVGLDRGLVRLSLEGETPVAVRVPELAGRPVRALHRSRDGLLWVGAVGGVHVFDGVGWRTWTVANGLPDETVNAFLEDELGNLWLGTDLGGLVKWSAEGFVSYDRDDGLGYANSAAFFRGTGGELLVASSQRAFVQRFDGAGFTAVQLALPAPAAAAARRDRAPLLLDRSGAWWAGTGRGLFRFPVVSRIEELAGRLPAASFSRRRGLPADVVRKLYEDRRGDLWIATTAPGAVAVWRRSRDAIEVLEPDPERLREATPTAFGELAETLWVGWSDGSLFVRRGAGLAHVASAPAAITALHGGPSGTLWVGTAGRGLHVWRTDRTVDGGGRLRAVAADDLRHASVSAITADDRGHLYVGTTGGVFQFVPRTGGTRALGRAAGLPLGEVLAASRDADGRLWFATLGGVSRFETRAAGPPAVARAWIGRVTVDGELRFAAPAGAAEAGGLRLGPEDRQLRVDFLIPSLGPAGAASLQVRLDHRREWSEPSPDRSLLLANLPAGGHHLEVRAVDLTGRAGPAATLRFEVVPPLWRRAWFLALAAAGLGAALYLAHRVRLSRALEVERVRTRIATDLHDELGSSLARVSVLSEVARRQLAGAPEASAGVLDEIGATARQLIGAVGDISMSIDPRRSTLDSLLARLRRFATDLLEGSGVGFEIVHRGIDPESVELSPEQRRHLLAALQELLHNVVRHAGASRVTVAVEVGERSIALAIADDGCGLAPPLGSCRGGQGLANVAGRAAAIGGSARFDFAAGRGTRCSLEIPRRVPARMRRRGGARPPVEPVASPPAEPERGVSRAHDLR